MKPLINDFINDIGHLVYVFSIIISQNLTKNKNEILLCGKKEDGFDFIQGRVLGFHLNEVKISSLPCNDFIKPTEKEETFSYKPICFLFLLLIWVWA